VLHEKIYKMRADEAISAGNQYAFALEAHRAELSSLRIPLYPIGRLTVTRPRPSSRLP
jgi:hypothetical protein